MTSLTLKSRSRSTIFLSALHICPSNICVRLGWNRSRSLREKRCTSISWWIRRRLRKQHDTYSIPLSVGAKNRVCTVIFSFLPKFTLSVFSFIFQNISVICSRSVHIHVSSHHVMCAIFDNFMILFLMLPFSFNHIEEVEKLYFICTAPLKACCALYIKC